MIPKYSVEFSALLKQHAPASTYSTDDPVACEEFIQELLDRGFKIKAIRHEGLDLPIKEFDRMVKTAASSLASSRICASLGIKTEEERYRFGFSA